MVFDCDGVLVDSEALSWAAWTEVLSGHGYVATPADEAASLGLRTVDLHAHFSARAALPDLAPFGAEVTAATLQRFRAALQPFADAVALLDHLGEAKMPLAVASSSSAERLSSALEITGIWQERFRAVVSGEEVTHGKPAPDIYLRASALLDVDPTDCWAIEDSPAGISAARAAGMRVIAIERGHVAADDLAAADVVVTALDAPEVTAHLLCR